MKKTRDVKRKNSKAEPKGKKNLSIANHGDVVVIRNRSTIASSVLAVIFLGLALAGAINLKEAWHLPMFWVAFALIIVGTLYSFANMIFNKITLDSPKMLMTVYNPFKKEYKISDINYVDLKTSKGSGGVTLHRVITYIGDGKRSVEIACTSTEQSDELLSLLRGMLDCGAMEYPEGDEEPFDFDSDNKVGSNLVNALLKNRAKKEDKAVSESPTQPSDKDVSNAQAEETRPHTDDGAELSEDNPDDRSDKDGDSSENGRKTDEDESEKKDAEA